MWDEVKPRILNFIENSEEMDLVRVSLHRQHPFAPIKWAELVICAIITLYNYVFDVSGLTTVIVLGSITGCGSFFKPESVI